MIKETIEKLENIIEKSNNKELKNDINEVIEDLLQVSIKDKRYYLKFKRDVNTFIGRALDHKYRYLNYDILEKIYYLETKNDSRFFKTTFTEDEIENLKLPLGFNIDMFEMIEAE